MNMSKEGGHAGVISGGRGGGIMMNMSEDE